MLTTVFTFVLLTFGAIFVDAENYVTQEQLRELLTANRVLSERLDKLQSTVAHCKGTCQWRISKQCMKITHECKHKSDKK